MTRFAVVGLALLTLLVAGSAGAASGAPPKGVTAIPLNGRVQLAWQNVGGATAYNVYRGTTPSSVTSAVTPAGGVTTKSFTDTSAANGTTYYYVVRAVTSGVESSDSLVVQATPAQPTCTTGNPVVVENCYPGTTTWRLASTPKVSAGGIEGYATAQSINKGGSVDLKVNTTAGVAYSAYVYRSGYYGGAGARLYSVQSGLVGTAQTGCTSNSTTGLYDCAKWTVSTTITTTSSWPSGVYIVRLVRSDNGAENEILFVVRDDARASPILYGIPFATYQAYNNYGGKSFYGFNSSGANTVAGTPQAVKVSFDRPYEQARTAATTDFHDWYTRTDYAAVYWLERSGYDLTYQSNSDMDTNGARVRNHDVYILGAHDEYYSALMRTALEDARDVGVSLFNLGANGVYWKTRYESGAGGANHVLVCYKTTATGAVDPTGSATGTWRDPAGANKPENALLGVMYVGDNSSAYFPLTVRAAAGRDRVFRYTSLQAQPSGTATDVGSSLVAWEWDSRVANGFEPPGVKTLATSAVYGNIIQNNGAGYVTAPATANAAKYVAPSGALVFSTGTNQWVRGLAYDAHGAGEPDLRIQQTTTNVLEDMRVAPTTPDSGIVVDNPASPRVVSTSPADAAANAAPGTIVSASFAGGMDPATITSSSFTITDASGAVVPGAVSYDAASKTATFAPTAPLATGAAYTAQLTTAVRDLSGNPLAFPYTWTFTTSGCPCTLFSDLAQPLNQSASGTYELGVKLRSDQPLTLKAIRFYKGVGETGGHTGTVWTTSGIVLASVNFVGETASGWQQQALSTPLELQANVTYVVSVNANSRYAVSTSGLASQVTSGPIHSVADGANGVYNTVRGAFPTQSYQSSNYYVDAVIGPGPAPVVVSRSPAAGATNVATNTPVQAAFSRPMDPATLTTSTVTLTDSSGAAVAATVAYDAATQRVTLTPSAQLAQSTTYTATVAAAAAAVDGVPLGQAVSWSFTTAAAVAVPPAVVSRTPASGAADVGRGTSVTATFDKALDASTVNTSTFTLRRPDGTSVPAGVAYDAATRTATLTPSALLAGSTTFTATIDASVSGTDGTPLGTPVTWSFTTTACPCQLFGDQATPASQSAGSFELGVKLQVDQPLQLTTLRFFKAAGESGSHVGTVWTAAGVPLARATFSNETATGWQQQTLPTPLQLQPNTTYVVSVNTNTNYAVTTSGLSAAVSSGPLHTVADGSNGVYSNTVGRFPDQSYASSNYFVDVVVAPDTGGAPSVLLTNPAAGATGVSQSAPVTASFSRRLDPATVNQSSFTLTAPDGSTVPATVSYDGSYVATLVPSSPLAGTTTYTAHVGAPIAAADGTPLSAPADWTFTTAACPCSLFSELAQPANQAAAGTFELGVKIQVAAPIRLTAVRFYKGVGETGTHTGTVWTSNGIVLGSVAFSNETASGWQQQALPTPIDLQPNVTYVVSVNANSRYAVTTSGLASPVTSGPLRSVDDGLNGVYSSTLGTFPTSSYQSSNYYVDVVVAP